MYTPNKYGYSPQQSGVSFFNHFPRFRLRPYGVIHHHTTDDENMLRTTSARNCEYLKRPKEGLSELGETVSANLEQLQELFTHLKPSLIMSELTKINRLVADFNKKAEKTVTPVMIHDILKYTLEDKVHEDMTRSEFYHGLEILGHISYLIGMHYRQMSVLVRNLEEYSKLCDLPLNHAFKSDPSLTNLKQWWTESACKAKTDTLFAKSSFGKRNLSAELDAEDPYQKDPEWSAETPEKRSSKSPPKKTKTSDWRNELGERPEQYENMPSDEEMSNHSATYGAWKKKSHEQRALAENLDFNDDPIVGIECQTETMQEMESSRPSTSKLKTPNILQSSEESSDNDQQSLTTSSSKKASSSKRQKETKASSHKSSPVETSKPCTSKSKVSSDSSEEELQTRKPEKKRRSKANSMLQQLVNAQQEQLEKQFGVTMTQETKKDSETETSQKSKKHKKSHKKGNQRGR